MCVRKCVYQTQCLEERRVWSQERVREMREAAGAAVREMCAGKSNVYPAHPRRKNDEIMQAVRGNVCAVVWCNVLCVRVCGRAGVQRGDMR